MARKKRIKPLKKRLWKIFSQYIRIRDADDHGYCKCITCGKRFHWKEMDAGHFISRAWNNLLFNEYNVNAQCHRCNRFLEGEKDLYGKALDKKYGKSTRPMLNKLKMPRNFKCDELEDMIDNYKDKLSYMAKLKNIDIN